MKKKAVVLIETILMIFSFFQTTVFADEKIIGYSIDLTTVDSDVKKYLTSLSIDEDNNVYMNNTFVGTVATDPQTFKYATTNYNVSATISTSNLTCGIKVSYTTQKTYQVVFDFDLTDEHDQSVNFYPDYPGSYESESATLSGDWYDFGTFSHNYSGTSKSFSVKLKDSTGELYINNSKVATLTKGSKNQTVYLEFHQDAEDLALDYLGSLPRFNWSTASANQRVFTDEEIDAAVAGKQITLKNNKTGLTYDVPLRRTINLMKRVNDGSAEGDGSYNQTESKYTAVCEWPEGSTSSGSYKSDCSSVSSLTRYWTMYGSSFGYTTVNKIKDQETVKEEATVYEYLVYPSSSYTTVSTQPTTLATRDIWYRFRTRPVTWSAWGTSACSKYGNIVDCQQRTAYAQSTRSWGSWSAYSTENKCGLLDTGCEDDSITRYRYRTRTYTPASYSAWSSWTAYAYNLLGCSESSLGTEKIKECRSTTAYAYRKIGDWGDWSSYSTTTCSPTYSGENNTQTTGCRSRTEYRSATRSYQYKSCATSACGVSSYTYGGWTYYYGSKGGSYTSQCQSKGTVTTSLCGTKTQYQASCTCTAPSSKKNKTCTGSWSDTKTACTISGCTNRKCSYTSKTVNKSCTKYYCPTTRTPNYKTCRNSACGEEDYGSWSSWTTTECSATTLKKCDTRTTYSKRTRSWGSYGDYSTSTTNLNNTLYDYKTQTWYSHRTRTYTAASVSDWGDWTNYLYTSCETTSEGGHTTKECDSQTLYHRRYLSAWSEYGSYNITETMTDYSDCLNDSNCRLKSQTQYRSLTAGDWGSYTSWIQADSSTGKKESISNMEYEFKYSDGVSNYSQTNGTTKDAGTIYYTGYSKKDTVTVIKDISLAKQGTNEYLTTEWKQTSSEINAAQNKYATGTANSQAYTALKKASETVYWSDFQNQQSTSNYTGNKNTAETAIENAYIYVPNLYISAHWRAIDKDMEVPGYTSSASLTETVSTNKTVNNANNATLIANTRPVSRNSKVIYFDYHDPLVNYDSDSPEYESVKTLIDIIESAQLDEKKVVIKMSKADVEDMKEWLDENNYNSGDDCKFLKQFSYIFDSTTQATITGKCRIGE